MSLVEVEGLEHSYFPEDPDASKALRGVSFRIESGEYLALVGANGSGKSTLALHLNALLLPTSGQVRIDGLDSAISRNWPRVRRTVAMVFQRPEEQIVALSVEEDVAFGPENAGLPQAEIRRRVSESLERVGLQGLEARSPHKLSAGQKQRLSIAGVLALSPLLIIFDEPTSMLDPAGRRDALALLRELNRSGIAVMHITHNMEEAAEAGRILALEAGRIAFDGPPEELFGSELAVVDSIGRPAALEASRSLRGKTGIDLGLPLTYFALEQRIASRLGEDGNRNRRASDPRIDVLEGAQERREPQGIGAPGEVEGASSAGEGGRSTALVRVRGLAHSYQSQQSLSGVSLEIARGECIALIGPTGSGKSTLLQHLNALFLPQAGSVELFGQRVSADSTGLAALRRRAGLVFQRPEEQIFARYVGDEVAYGPRLAGLGGKALTERVRWAMESVGLDFPRYRDRPTFALSGGEQRKVGIAGVLALRPELLLLDEPGAGLDPAARREVNGLIERLRREGTTIVLSTHDMGEALSLADRLLVLVNGSGYRAGRPTEVFLEEEALQAIGLEVPASFACARRLVPGASTAELPVDLPSFVEFLARLLADSRPGERSEGALP